MGRSSISPADITAVQDAREQRPLDLSPLKTVIGTLQTADYTVLGLQEYIAIERKSLPDLLGCIGRERERFEKEIQRLLAYETRAIVVEATWTELEAGEWLLGTNRYPWKSRVNANAAVGSVLGWVARGIPILFVGDHERAGKFVARILFTAARRRWEELQSFKESLRLETPKEKVG